MEYETALKAAKFLVIAPWHDRRDGHQPKASLRRLVWHTSLPIKAVCGHGARPSYIFPHSESLRLSEVIKPQAVCG
jgi:hypothetical protein